MKVTKTAVELKSRPKVEAFWLPVPAGRTIDNTTGNDLAAVKDRFVWDPQMPGFGVRIGPTSTRWVCQYRIDGKQRRESLGDIRKVTEADARKAAQIRFGQVAKEIDPKAEKASKRSKAEEDKVTFEMVVARFLRAKYGAVKPKTHERLTLDLTQKWKTFAKRPIKSIKKKEIAERLHEIVDESAKLGSARNKNTGVSGRSAAGNARRHLSSLFSWAIGEGDLDVNPVLNSNNPAADLKGRSRVLTDDELAKVWLACEPEGVSAYCRSEALGAEFGKIMRLLILTGCRREEIGGLRWEEVDMEAATISIPPERIKNRHPLKLTLPPMAMDILQSALPADGRQLVFGNGRNPFNSYQFRMHQLRERISVQQGKMMPYWVIHDLRRTMRTGMAKLGIEQHVGERVLNHVKTTGVIAIYNQFKYEKPMQDALQKWADHVASIVDAKRGNVVSLRRAS